MVVLAVVMGQVIVVLAGDGCARALYAHIEQ
jgi:hypothetical protein